MHYQQLIRDYWKKVLIIIIIFVIITLSFLFTKQEQPKQSLTSKTVKISISGDVNQSGNYEVLANLSVDQAINQYAKGLKQVDDPKVEIQITNPEKKPFQPVKINEASVEELQTIKGVGSEKAKRIIDYRKKHGPFKSKEDLMEVPGFGQATVEKILPYIDFSHS